MDKFFTWGSFVLWTVIVILVMLPPPIDPAIRLKEWLQYKAGYPQHPQKMTKTYLLMWFLCASLALIIACLVVGSAYWITKTIVEWR